MGNCSAGPRLQSAVPVIASKILILSTSIVLPASHFQRTQDSEHMLLIMVVSGSIGANTMSSFSAVTIMYDHGTLCNCAYETANSIDPERRTLGGHTRV